ncbi:MAG: restriction endonuclease subunit S [Clostridiales bacterium]|nr:restriction endonuclease subunit S [Clostridiales bacterium]
MAIYKELVRKVPIPADKKTKRKDYLEKGELPIIDQGQGLIGGYSSDLSKKISCELPVIVFGDHTKCVKFVSFPFGAGADGIKVLQPQNGILPKYLLYGTKYLTYRMVDKGYARHYQFIEKMSLDVPSETEQVRIVARIEELFSELDKAVETLQTTKKQLAVYRQAVLKEAFDTGNNSEYCEISEIVDDIRIGPFGTMLHKSDYIAGGIPVINPQHIKELSITPGKSISISVEKAAELSAYRLRPNDIIMGRRGEMGRAAAVTSTESDWICGTGSIIFRLKPEYNADFFARILASPDTVRYLNDHATGTTMKNLNEDIVRHIPVPNINRAKQAKITQYLDEKQSVCDSIEKTVDAALAQAEAMRQSILKEAFEGRLI